MENCKFFLIYLIFSFSIVNFSVVSGLVYDIQNECDLKAILTVVNPGDTLRLVTSPGYNRIIYGPFNITRSGTPENPIRFIGTGEIVISTHPDPPYNSDVAMHMSASYWIFEGLYIENSSHGVVMRGAHSNKFKFLNLEGNKIAFNSFDSSENVIENARIRYNLNIGILFQNKSFGNRIVNLEASGVSSSTGSGVIIWDGSNFNSVEGGRIQDYGYGIQIFESSSHNLVIDMTMWYTDGSYVTIGSSENDNCINNTIIGNKFYNWNQKLTSIKVNHPSCCGSIKFNEFLEQSGTAPHWIIMGGSRYFIQALLN